MFITLEGIDGCGKTTQVQRLAQRLEEELGKPVLVTYEPGGWGNEALRSLLLSQKFEHPYSQMLLFMADRLEHLQRVICPALQQGSVVICDRYLDSTYAYQVGHSQEREEVFDALVDALNPVMPDVTFYLDLSPEQAWQRRCPEEHDDVFERQGLAFQESLKKAFDRRAEANSERIVVVDATLSIEELTEECIRQLKSRGLC